MNSRKFKVAFFLSMVILGSLFSALILSELIPALRGVTETSTLNLIDWQYIVEEPTRHYPVGLYENLLVPVYDSDEVALEQAVGVEFSWFFVTNDEARIRLSTNATAKSGFLSSISLTFQDTKPSSLWWPRTHIQFKNLLLTRVEDSGYDPGISDWNGHASLEFASLTRTNSMEFSVELVWPITNSENATNMMQGEITYVYRSGFAFKSIVQPIRLAIVTATALGLQYLEIHTIVPGELNATELTGVKVWIDDVEYDSPVSIMLPAANRTIRVESPTYVNGTEFLFNYWTDWEGGHAGNPLWVGSTSKMGLKAVYDEHM